jgi:hypothetical protein
MSLTTQQRASMAPDATIMTTDTNRLRWTPILAVAGLCASVLCACVQGIEPTGPGGEGGDDSSSAGPGGGGDASAVGSGGDGATASGSGVGGAASSSAASGSTGGASASSSVSSSATGSPVTGVSIEYKTGDNTPNNNSINPHFRIVNGGATTVDLSNITIRYWYTIEAGSTTHQLHCDWAMLDCATITPVGSFAPASGMNADHYLEISFGGGSVAAGGDSGPIQLRFNKDDWSLFDETNDYSWDATKTMFAAWDKVTAYSGGRLIWGTEP